ncbi:unnamed protein product [Dibothriocephalus latus]|uniref:Bicarbonate transporter-like transmembrane domain-containing protein n=1 Tax=Dibothriocephalus latus TaxID=60516 RepID=A0A3P6TK13_DIBLA|nr:unnamed protein product [Dibothriocephalus latus]
MDVENGTPSRASANMFIELSELTAGVPRNWQTEQDTATVSCRYWHERYRWVEMEEALDDAVGEFAPPEMSKFTFEDLSIFRSQIKKDLVFKVADYATVEEAFDGLPPICSKSDELLMSSTRGGYCIPFYHPQVANQNRVLRKLSTDSHRSSEIPMNKDLTRCLSPTSTSCCILAGCSPDLESPMFQVLRFKTPVEADGLVEVPRPLQFLIISMTPQTEFVQEAAFYQACEKAVSRDEVYAACKYQLCHWIFQGDDLERGGRSSASEESDPFEEVEVAEDEPEEIESVSLKDQIKAAPRRCFHRMCPPLRDLALGLVAVIKRYPSDFKDAFVNGNATVAVGSILFVYFVIFSPAITFGTLMSTQVNSAYSVSNSILTSGFQTILYSLFAGQPIAIIGPSGPGFIMEKLVAREAAEINMDYWCFRSWVLMYAIIMGFFLLALNLSELTMHAKKSLEELFSAFISGYLIIKAMFSLLRNIPQTLPVLNGTVDETMRRIWHIAADYGVDNFLALLMVCFSMTIVKFKTSHLVRRRVRFWVGAMNVPLGMIAISAMNRIFFWAYDIKRLKIPPVTELNYSTWFNIPNFSNMTNYGTASASYAHGRAVIFGFILGILIFVEIALNSIVPLRGLSKKKSPIVVDHFLANIIFPIMGLCLGMPILSGVPIRTIANMVALARMESHPAPGKPPKYVKYRLLFEHSL